MHFSFPLEQFWRIILIIYYRIQSKEERNVTCKIQINLSDTSCKMKKWKWFLLNYYIIRIWERDVGFNWMLKFNGYFNKISVFLHSILKLGSPKRSTFNLSLRMLAGNLQSFPKVDVFMLEKWKKKI